MVLAPGSTLRGKYLLTASIGRGGMGEVFAARRLSDHCEVAVKVVSHRIIEDTLMARLEREAFAAQRIQSIYVPDVYEIDRTEEGELYLVMRRLHGESLAARLKEQHVLHWPDVQRIVDDILSGLADAHAAGVVHRDLKPGNIFLERIEEPTVPAHLHESWVTGSTLERAMILDFGVCKMDGSDGQKLTVTGESVGTVSYMAPEQIRGASDVDDRADLYSLGMVVFELVCGRLAYDATGQMAMLAAKLEGQPHRIRDCAVVATPAGLDAFVSRALSRRPQDRFESAREMQQAWRGLGSATESPHAQPDTNYVHAYVTQTALTTSANTRVGNLVPRAGLLAASLGVFASAIAIALAMHRPKARETRVMAEDFAGTAVQPVTLAPSSAASAQGETMTVPGIEFVDGPDDAGSAHARSPWRPRKPVTPAQPAQSGQHLMTQPRY